MDKNDNLILVDMLLNKISPKKLFFIISLTGIIGFFISALFLGEKEWIWLIQESDPKIRALDYTVHISSIFSGKYLYDYAGEISRPVFPPLAYLMYGLFYNLGFANVNEIVYNAENIISHDINAYIYLIYSTLSILLLAFSIILVGKKYNKTKEAFLLFIILFFSAPMLGSAFLAGNSIILVISLLILFFYLRDSENKKERELALILLAIAAGLKMYPAIFGLLYLKEKRFKEAIRLIIYGLLFFFVPFIFFDGLKGFINWFNLVSKLSALQYDYRIQYIKGLTFMLGKHIINNSNVLDLITNITPIIFVLLMFILFCLSKNKYRSILFLVFIMIFFPNNSFRYVLNYLFIPFIFYFLEKGDERKNYNYFVMIIYALIFSIPIIFGLIIGFRTHIDKDAFYRTFTFVELYLYFNAYLFMGSEVVREIYLLYKKKGL